MVDRFEQLLTGVTTLYKSIQKIKKLEMEPLGLRSAHVMPLYYLSCHPEGVTAADLCQMCRQDKGGISRILAELEKKGLLRYDTESSMEDRKKYRVRAILTEEGQKVSEKISSLIINATMRGGEALSEEEREIFYSVLALISNNLHQLCIDLESEE